MFASLLITNLCTNSVAFTNNGILCAFVQIRLTVFAFPHNTPVFFVLTRAGLRTKEVNAFSVDYNYLRGREEGHQSGQSDLGETPSQYRFYIAYTGQFSSNALWVSAPFPWGLRQSCLDVNKARGKQPAAKHRRNCTSAMAQHIRGVWVLLWACGVFKPASPNDS